VLLGYFFTVLLNTACKIVILKDTALNKTSVFCEMFGTKPQFDLTCATLQAQVSNLRNLMGRYLALLTNTLE